MSVRINARLPIGDIEIEVPLHLSMADTGTEHLQAALVEASNRVLRAYGQPEIEGK